MLWALSEINSAAVQMVTEPKPKPQLDAELDGRVTTHVENMEKSGKWKKSGEVKSGVFFKVLNTPKLVFRPGLCPAPCWGS